MLSRSRQRSEPPLPDYPAERCPDGIPAPVTGIVQLKERNKWKRARRFYAELNRGYLKVWKSKKQKEEKAAGTNSVWSAKIDIGAVVVVPESNRYRFQLQFSKVTQILTPIDRSTFDVWLNGIKYHRLYRQEGRRDGEPVSPPHQDSASGGLPDVPEDNEKEVSKNDVSELIVSPSSDNRKISEGLEATTRVMDEAKEMFNMSLDVASSLVRTAEQLSSVQKQLKLTVHELRLGIIEIKAISKSKVSPLVLDPRDESLALQTARQKSFDYRHEDDTETFEDAKAAQSRRTIEAQKELLDRIRNLSESTRETPILPSQPRPVSPTESVSQQVQVYGPLRQRRTKLPAKMIPGEALGMGAIAKMAFSKTGLPMSHFEPISMVQALCEELRYAKYLTQAAQLQDPVERMAMIAAFAISGYSNTKGRSRKPFNPLLGETFDYVEPEWRFHGEQVSHHPPVTAGFAEGNGWVWWQSMDANAPSKLSSTIEITQSSPVRIKLATYDGEENYSVEKVKTIIENATNPEKRKVNYLGKLRIVSTSGYVCELHFRKENEIRGDIFKGDVVACRLMGRWDKELLKISTTGENSLIFEAMRASEASIDYYGFNSFTVTLNEMPCPNEKVPPTDSRLRPDQRALENGQVQLAQRIKKQLEEAQRNRGKSSYSPFWFESGVDAMTQRQLYTPNMKYWPEKERGFTSTDFIEIFPK